MLTDVFIGDYKAQVDEALSDRGITDPTNFQRQNSLFYCVGPPEGQIAYLETCSLACVNAGTGNDDSCYKSSGFPISSGRNRLKAGPDTEDEDRRLVINW